MTGSSAAALLVEEGLRMDAHPGVLFRDGATGRRAVLVAGPDVWEAVRAIRDARAAEPGLEPEAIMKLANQNTGVPEPALRIALDYYGAFAEEIDAQIPAVDAAEADLARSLSQTRRLLGA